MSSLHLSEQKYAGSHLGFSLCHGWAFDQGFMQPLAIALQHHFPNAAYTFWDLGFSGKAQTPKLDMQRQWIAVGHSYGFAHLLQTECPWHAAIAINGFTHFCGIAGTPTRVIDRMLNQLHTHLDSTLATFYQRCGRNSVDETQTTTTMSDITLFPQTSDLLADKLAQALHAMRDLNLALPTYPLLVLAGMYDLIVPTTLIAENFAACAQTRYLAGDHLLPIKSAQQCANEIAQFVKQLYV